MYGDLSSPTPEKPGQERFRKLAIKFLDSKNINFLAENIELKDVFESALLTGNILGEYLYRSLTVEADTENIRPQLLKFTLSQDCYIKFRDQLLNKRDFQNHLKRYF